MLCLRDVEGGLDVGEFLYEVETVGGAAEAERPVELGNPFVQCVDDNQPGSHCLGCFDEPGECVRDENVAKALSSQGLGQREAGDQYDGNLGGTASADFSWDVCACHLVSGEGVVADHPVFGIGPDPRSRGAAGGRRNGLLTKPPVQVSTASSWSPLVAN
ncbi:hypothetical protein BH24ACT12_BH24ACT12_28770 [soil metagenome]